MGGIVAGHLHDPRIAWQRIVMLAPPNQGSRLARELAAHPPNQGSWLARELAAHPLYRWFHGPAGRELADAAR